MPDFRNLLPDSAGSERMEAFYSLPEDVQSEYWASLRQRVERERKPSMSERLREAPAESPRRLKNIPADIYIERIAGVEVAVGKRVCCPLPDHEDHSLDFRIYKDHKWRCFGCNRHGDIYEFAGLLWGYPMAGRQFKELQQRLLEVF